MRPSGGPLLPAILDVQRSGHPGQRSHRFVVARDAIQMVLIDPSLPDT